jgi:hypothetical protein
MTVYETSITKLVRGKISSSAPTLRSKLLYSSSNYFHPVQNHRTQLCAPMCARLPAPNYISRTLDAMLQGALESILPSTHDSRLPCTLESMLPDPVCSKSPKKAVARERLGRFMV